MLCRKTRIYVLQTPAPEKGRPGELGANDDSFSLVIELAALMRLVVPSQFLGAPSGLSHSLWPQGKNTVAPGWRSRVRADHPFASGTMRLVVHRLAVAHQPRPALSGRPTDLAAVEDDHIYRHVHGHDSRQHCGRRLDSRSCRRKAAIILGGVAWVAATLQCAIAQIIVGSAPMCRRRGQLPFRVYSHLMHNGTGEVFELGDRIRTEFYNPIGLENLLNPALAQ
jgi:hypothetical protein